jgi:hypothetical protein
VEEWLIFARDDYVCGRAAHMNLRDEYLPYRYVIGQVMLDVSSMSTPTAAIGHC